MQGYKRKYFSLSAILALSATVTLSAQTEAFSAEQKELVANKNVKAEQAEIQEAVDEPIVVISKKIKAKKSKVFSASKNIVSKTNLTDNVSVITSEEMKFQGFSTVTEALNSLSGVSFSSNGGLGQLTSLWLQGFSNKYTLVLVDGVSYNDPTNTSGADLSNLLLLDVDKIEVIKGTQSGVWGGNAAAGVINIITKKAKTAGTHASLLAEYGSYDTRTLSSTLSHRTREFDIALSLLRKTSDSFSSQTIKGEDLDKFEDDAYRNTTINFKSGYWINPNNRVEIGYHDVNSLTHYDSFDPNSNVRSDYRGKSGFLKYKFFTGHHNIEAKISQSYFKNKQIDALWGLSGSIGKTPSVEIKDTYKYGKDNALVLGASYEKRDIEYTQVGGLTSTKDDTSKSVFINNTYRINNIVLTQALRYDNFSDYKNKLTGKVGAKYLFNDDVNVYANFATGHLSPNIMDMINIWGVSNFELKPENIRSYNAGVNYKNLHVNFFRNEIDNMISWDVANNQNVNIDETSKLEGIEVSYSKLLSEKFLLGFNYTFLRAKDADGNILLRRPNHQVGINTTYEVISSLKIHTNATYIGSRKDQDFSTWPAASVDTGKYFLANLKVDYQINKNWKTYLKIDNVFNKEYQSAYGYATPERSFYLGIEAKF